MSACVPVGSTVVLSVEATASLLPLTYKWFERPAEPVSSGDGSSGYTPISSGGGIFSGGGVSSGGGSIDGALLVNNGFFSGVDTPNLVIISVMENASYFVRVSNDDGVEESMDAQVVIGERN